MADPRSVANARTRYRALIAAATTQRDAAAASEPSVVDAASYRVALIPYNPDVVAPLPAARRERFENNLRAALAEARRGASTMGSLRSATPVTDREAEVAPERDRPALPLARLHAEQALLGEGCATCRGFCCRHGGDHAFLRVEAMAAHLQAFPGSTDDEVVAHYLAYVPQDTMSAGCVYQRDTGCALPRERRAPICNAYHCSGLNMVRDHTAEGEPVRAFFIHRIDEGLQGGRFVDVPVPTE